MNINQDPVSRREASQSPSQTEQAAMRATRAQVRASEVELRPVARPEAATKEDRIEISAEATRRSSAAESGRTERRELIQRLREAHKGGELNTTARREAAAEKMMRKEGM